MCVLLVLCEVGKKNSNKNTRYFNVVDVFCHFCLDEFFFFRRRVFTKAEKPGGEGSIEKHSNKFDAK